MKKLMKYFPDIIIIIGIWILSYNFFRPVNTFRLANFHPHTGSKVFGVILVTVGIDILIRRYYSYKSDKK